MIELIGLICLVILQGLHVYHDYMKFKRHGNEIDSLKRQRDDKPPEAKDDLG